MRRALSLFIMVACLTAAPRAWAQHKAAADVLFREGKLLMEAGETEAACRKFEGSLKLMKQLGVLLNLAVCYEGIGRLSAAYAVFRATEIAAKEAGDKRAGYARERGAEVEARMSTITISLSPKPA